MSQERHLGRFEGEGVDWDHEGTWIDTMNISDLSPAESGISQVAPLEALCLGLPYMTHWTQYPFDPFVEPPSEAIILFDTGQRYFSDVGQLDEAPLHMAAHVPQWNSLGFQDIGSTELLVDAQKYRMPAADADIRAVKVRSPSSASFSPLSSPQEQYSPPPLDILVEPADYREMKDERGRRFLCRICSVTARRRGDIKRHCRRHQLYRIPCPVPDCSRTFIRLDNRKEHLRRHAKCKPSDAGDGEHGGLVQLTSPS